MTGEELYRKAQNNGKGFIPFEKLSSQQKGLWANAARELGHEREAAWVRGRDLERNRIVRWIRHGNHSYSCDGQLLDDIEDDRHREFELRPLFLLPPGDCRR